LNRDGDWKGMVTTPGGGVSTRQEGARAGSAERNCDASTVVWVSRRLCGWRIGVGWMLRAAAREIEGCRRECKVLDRNGTPSPWDISERDPPSCPRRALLRNDSAELADERLAVLSNSTEPP
jgi:hypothetical protein